MALILVAEDDSAIATLLRDVLSSHGHRVIVVSDGVQMIEQARDSRPQLIVADIMMPGAYGSSACKTLREDPATAQIPIVFLTALSPDKASRVVPQSETICLLYKPLELSALGLLQDVNKSAFTEAGLKAFKQYRPDVRAE